jgi:hypothetical protein
MPPNPMTDPNMMENMMGGMKSQMIMMIPQQILMYWINSFFSGFLLSEYFDLVEKELVLNWNSQTTVPTHE